MTQIHNLKLLNCDCMEYMATVPDKHFDLAIVDPPYGINWMDQIKSPNNGKNWNQYDHKNWDAETPSVEYFYHLYRTSKNQIVWGANYFKEMAPSPCWVIWDKMQEFSGATFEMAWTSFASPSKAFRMARCQAYVGVNKIHPTQKPVALYEWLLANYAKPGQRILDTHLGSGSHAIAAHYFGVSEFVGCELDPDYYAASIERIKRETSQLDIFGEVSV